MKPTEEQKKQIKRLIKKGNQIKEIALLLGLSQTTVSYWGKPELREKRIERQKKYFRKKSKKEKKEIYKSRLEYNKQYKKEKYTNDPDYREKQKKWSREYKRRKK